jgi:hypothetical protein
MLKKSRDKPLLRLWAFVAGYGENFTAFIDAISRIQTVEMWPNFD